MKPLFHILYATIISLLIRFLFNIPIYLLFIFWISSWLIPDMDHYFSFIFKNKSVNISNFLNVSYNKRIRWKNIKNIEKNNYKYTPMFFHSVEFIILMTLTSFLKLDFLYIAMGILFHDFLDIIDFYNRRENIFVKMSFIYTLIYNKNRRVFK